MERAVNYAVQNSCNYLIETRGFESWEVSKNKSA
ncbi:hypothetical protein DSM02_1965 [Leeuwenhoekiella polynyae]|uniref:Uncharacterized protein n=1 Tax=Leeuwenhoekiella polynyae TaxID=1550906 RepID=A0A4Q0P540_9FLAO|nr:hypothetical protein DSM02_1965 [Leeuwenhoekiella polynyae]